MEQQKLFEATVMAEQVKTKISVSGKHWLFKTLLNGGYIIKRGGKNKRFEHCLYKGKNEPVRLISKVEWKKISVLTREKKDRYFINLLEVRRLHGNTIYKKLYRQFKKQQKNNS